MKYNLPPIQRLLSNIDVRGPDENMRDKIAKGRYAKELPTTRGEQHHNHKLAVADVLEIRRRHDTGESREAIAADYPVGSSSVVLIGKRRRWKWLPEA